MILGHITIWRAKRRIRAFWRVHDRLWSKWCASENDALVLWDNTRPCLIRREIWLLIHRRPSTAKFAGRYASYLKRELQSISLHSLNLHPSLAELLLQVQSLQKSLELPLDSEIGRV